jgi:RNA polymerase sigma factor (sigma-70 family)
MPSPSVALLRTQSDERLVALAAAGHERAFEAIVERYRRPLLRHCRRYLPEARAEDALQQALVAAWTALCRGDDVQALRPWLYRIVHNTALNALRAAGYDYEELREILVSTDPRGGPAEAAEHRAVVQRTLAGLAALPERQREALLAIAVEGRSQEEVAQDLGLSTGGVRQLVHRARTSLRTAATAAIPLPLATWLATAGGGRADVAVRIGELVTGAGAGATLAKAGTVAVLAGGVVGGPAVVDEIGGHGEKSPRAAAAAPRADATREPRAVPAAPVAVATARPAATAAPRAGAPAGTPPTGGERDGDGGGRDSRKAGRERAARGGGDDGARRHGGGDGGGRDDDGAGDHDAQRGDAPDRGRHRGQGSGGGGDRGRGNDDQQDGDDGAGGERGGKRGDGDGDGGNSGKGGNSGNSGKGDKSGGGREDDDGEEAAPAPPVADEGDGSGDVAPGSGPGTGAGAPVPSEDEDEEPIPAGQPGREYEE